MFSVRLYSPSQGEWYLPKSPYTDDEIHNGYVTRDPERIATFKHPKTAENRVNALTDIYETEGFSVVEVVPAPALTLC